MEYKNYLKTTQDETNIYRGFQENVFLFDPAEVAVDVDGEYMVIGKIENNVVSFDENVIEQYGLKDNRDFVKRAFK